MFVKHENSGQTHEEPFETESFTPSGGSPYSQTRRLQKINVNSDNDEHSTSNIFTFDSPQGSPYSRRYPLCEKQMLKKKYSKKIPKSELNRPYSPNSSKNDSVLLQEAADIQGISLPIEMHRCQSMQNLRRERDPHYSGVRSRKAKRVITKTGERNVGFLNIPERSWRFFKDFVNTLIDEQWRYVITVFALSFFLCWILFAILWYLIAHAHGDLNFDPKTGERLNEGNVPCVENAFNFVGFLLFSIETQVSIGYGTKYPNEECPEAIFLMVAQIVCGIAIEGAMVGIVYAKMIRPPRHTTNMQFSRKAVICQRDSQLCLVFRISDSRQGQAISSKVEAYLFEEKISLEGEKLKNFQHTLELENDGKIFLIFPMTICHVIDCSSPFYDVSAKDLLEKKFEIVVTLTGLSSLTGQMMQVRTSYLPKEIMWGHRFVNMVRYDKTYQAYASDFDKFDELEVVDTPLCSARRFEEVQEELIEEIFGSPLDTLSPDFVNENLDKINRINESHEYFILSPEMIRRQDPMATVKFTSEYERGAGSVDALGKRFSREVSADELTYRLNEHRRSLDTETVLRKSTMV